LEKEQEEIKAKQAEAEQKQAEIVESEKRLPQLTDREFVQVRKLLYSINANPWNPVLHGKNISIQGCNADRLTGGNCFDEGFALSLEGLSMTSKTVWAIRVLNLTGIICVGMGLKQVVINNKYSFNNAIKTGHGCYMICSDGYSFSHSEAQNNHVPGKISKFNTNGSIVWMEWDPSTWLLRFRVNGSKASKDNWQLTVQKPPQGDNYYISTIMVGEKSSVELLWGRGDEFA